MKHDWHPDESAQGHVAVIYYTRKRVCRKCGAKQSYEDIHYDVMATPKLTQAWRPLVGRCTLAKRQKHNKKLALSMLEWGLSEVYPQ